MSVKPFHGVVAITGSIGSGKSCVAHWLVENCAMEYIDADAIVRSLLDVGQPGWSALRHKVSGDFFHEDGSVDKGALRAAIFNDAGFRNKINALLHPLVLKEIAGVVSQKEQEGGGKYLVEIPLLYEVGWQDLFSFVIVVSAAENQCVARVCARDHVAAEQATAAFHVQLPVAKKEAFADYVIYNSGVWPETVVQLQALKKVLLCFWAGKKP